MRHLVSIIIPTFNRQALLAQAIRCCLDQTYQGLEVVVVDDGSSDGTEAYVRGLHDPRVVYIKQPSQAGMMAALNAGFSHARGEYLAWLSDDDVYLPEAVEVMAAELDRDPDVAFVYARYDKVDGNGNFLAAGRVEDPDWLDRDNCVGHCFLYRRCVCTEVGLYSKTPFLAEDYAYWLRVRAKFRMKKIDRVLGRHSMHPASLTVANGVLRMVLAAEQARRPFIPAWKHHFFVAERHYHQKSYLRAWGHVLVAVCSDPFHAPSWRLLVLLALPGAVVAAVRACRTGKRV